MKNILITIAAVLSVGCGGSPIHDAVSTENIEAIKQHLAAGADVNAKDEDGKAPLHKAALHGRKEIAEMLIANGADVNVLDGGNSTPLDMAIFFAEAKFYNYKGIVDLLRKHGGKTGEELKAEGLSIEPQKVIVFQPPDISIHQAASVGHIEAVKQHIDAGTDVNAKQDNNEQTPLHWAAGRGHKETTELLIAKGADVNAKNIAGETPLDFADGETADLLRKHGGKTGKELKAEGL